MHPRNTFWANVLSVSEAYMEKSWEWSKTKFVEGKARDIHFKLLHNAIYTNNRVSKFTDNPSTCLFCEFNGQQVLEDNCHLFIHCPRATEIYTTIHGLLEKLAERNVSLVDFIIGLKSRDKYKQTAFNFIIQNAQLSLWQARRNLEYKRHNPQADYDVNAIFLLRTNLFRSLCRIKIYTGETKFFQYFDDLTAPNNSIVGFRLKNFNEF
jgi:hypothetical protein